MCRHVHYKIKWSDLLEYETLWALKCLPEEKETKQAFALTPDV